MAFKTLQKVDDEYLERCKEMTPEQFIEFLENFRLLHGGRLEQDEKEKEEET